MAQRRVKDLKRIVKVTWTDSVGSNGWRPLRDEDKDDPTYLSTCRTVGYLLRATKREVVLAASTDVTCNNVDHIQAIPRAMVQKMETLEVQSAAHKERREDQGRDAEGVRPEEG